jgi:hypothetical protein
MAIQQLLEAAYRWLPRRGKIIRLETRDETRNETRSNMRMG